MEALDRLAEEIEPTLVAVLSHINMPGMDGLELLREINMARFAVRVVTAYDDDERRQRARELGALEFMTKPIDFDQLKAQLRRLPVAEVETLQRSLERPLSRNPWIIGKVRNGAL